MQKLSWEENLQKAEYPAASAPAPTLEKRAKDPNVEKMFIDLVRIAGDDDDVTGIVAIKTFDTDAAISDAPDPVAALIKAQTDRSARSSNYGSIEGKSLEVVLVNGRKEAHYYDANGALSAVRVLDVKHQSVDASPAVEKILGIAD